MSYLRAIVILVFILFHYNSFSQDSPPPPLIPSKDNSLLIDSIIKITGHEDFFINYCTDKVKAVALKNNWKNNKTDEIIKSIRFNDYKFTISNNFAKFTTEDLKKLIVVAKLLNSNSHEWNRMIITNRGMQNNLDVYIEGLIKGKYIRD